jgi:uncharacterized protein (DUF2336 family)
MLRRLLDLTSDASPTGRRDLLNAVTDLFLMDRTPSEASKDDYAYIATRSLDQLDRDDRAAYAGRVAVAPTLPRKVATKLANDNDIAVAHLVLKLSPVLSDEDLTSIALTHSQEHLIAIAQRAAVAEITTEVLADRGNPSVLETLSANPGASFSERGMSRLVERSRGNPQVANNLAARAPERQAQRVLRLAVKAEQADADQSTDARKRQEQVKILIADVLKHRRELDDVIASLAGEDRAFDLAVVLSTFAKLPAAHILKVLLAPDVGGLAVICRSVNLLPYAFSEVLKLRAARLKQDQGRIDRDLERYEAPPDPIEKSLAASLSVRRDLI